MGPKNNEPTKIPAASTEKICPIAFSPKSNFDFKSEAMDPSVISPMPNDNIPKQAAQKTDLLLYTVSQV